MERDIHLAERHMAENLALIDRNAVSREDFARLAVLVFFIHRIFSNTFSYPSFAIYLNGHRRFQPEFSLTLHQRVLITTLMQETM